MRVAIIDGTGAADDTAYFKEMKFSFCSMAARQLGPRKSYYQRGPSNDGRQVGRKARRAAKFLRNAKYQNEAMPIYLMGYSRGASIAIMAAEELQQDGINVDGLFMFDCVARHPFKGGTSVPGNVLRTWHAMRTDDEKLIKKYAGMASPHIPLPKASGNPMRPWFGHAGTKAKSPKALNYSEKVFPGSHGAIGGVGWRFVAEDVACQNAVAAWMNVAFKTAGIGVTLKPVKPAGTPTQGSSTAPVHKASGPWVKPPSVAGPLLGKPKPLSKSSIAPVTGTTQPN
ncbi:MAG: thioesterase domain-containing protein [Pseudomonadota bacterium]